MSFYAKYVPPSAGGGGTVTSITAGNGLTGGTITSSGTIAFDQSHLTLDGSTSGSFTQRAANVTTTYSVKWPSAQGTASTFLQNDGAGNLSWAAGSGGGSTFLDSAFRIQDNGDTTKQLAFEVSAITTGTTRTWTVPDTSLNFATSTSGTFATNTLSNLGITSVNSNLVADTSTTRDIGSSAIRWNTLFLGNNVEVYNGINQILRLSPQNITTPTGATIPGLYNLATGATGNQRGNALATANDANNDANGTGVIRLETGNKTSGTGISGLINIQTGSSAAGSSGSVSVQSGTSGTNSGSITLSTGTATGTRGKIKFVDGSEGTSGYVWTSTDTAGSGAWMASGGGGANTTLSNLGTTALNANLIAAIDFTLQTQNVTGVTNSHILSITTGSAVNGDTGEIDIYTGSSTNSNAGAISIHPGDSGHPTFDGSGIDIYSGYSSTKKSGLATFRSNDATGSAANSGLVSILSGNSSSGTSGKILLQTGTGSSRGKIQFKDGSEGTSGYVWTSTDTLGNGAWMASGGGSTSQDFVIQDSGSNTVGHLSTTAANDLDADIQLINTADSVDLQSYGIGLGTSNKVSTDNSRAVVVRSGRVVDGFSGDVELFSGFALSAGNSGIMNLLSGSVASGVSGLATLSSGSASASGGTSGNVSVFSGSSLDSTTGNVSILSGNSSTGTTGNVSLTTGTPGAGGTSGNIDLNTAATDGASSGHFIANTGGVNNSGNSGNIGLATGPSDTATSGSLAFSTGGANSGNTGNASIITGDSAGSGLSGTIFLTTGEIDSGTSGDIVLQTGPGSTRGSIKLGSNVLTLGTAPSISNLGQLGSGSSVSVIAGSTDTAGRIRFQTGTGAGTGGVSLVTVTFNAAYPNDAFIVLYPSGANAGTLTGQQLYINQTAGSSFTLETNGDLVDSTTYDFNYIVIGR